VRFWERWPPVVREREREKKEVMVSGLNFTGSTLGQTMSGLVELCSDGTLCPRGSSRLGNFSKIERFNRLY
jgi:hypothetical protein